MARVAYGWLIVVHLFWLDSGGLFRNASVLCPAFATQQLFSEDRSRLLPVVRNQECCNRRLEAEGNDDKDSWGTKASSYYLSLLIEQRHIESRRTTTSFDANTHNTFFMLTFHSKEMRCDCRWFCLSFSAISALFFFAALCTDGLCRRLWRCFGHLALWQTTMPVPFDSNKPSFSRACLCKLRHLSGQSTPSSPSIRLSVRQARVGDQKPKWLYVCHLSEWIADIFVWIWLMLVLSVYSCFIPPASSSRVPILQTPLAPWSNLGQCAPLMQQMEARLDEKLATWLFKTSGGVKSSSWPPNCSLCKANEPWNKRLDWKHSEELLCVYDVWIKSHMGLTGNGLPQKGHGENAD